MIKAIKNLTKKQIIIIVSSLVVLTGIITTTILLLTKDKEEIKKCLVEFDTNGGSTIDSQEITCGNTITEPNTKPEKTGFEFINWTYNNEEFDFNTKINENIVLIANYNKTTTEEIITVTFNTDGGSEVKPIELIKGTTITEPVSPTKQNYNFEGWYLNENKFDFTQAINENITLSAKWSEVKNNQGSSKPNGGTSGNQGGNSKPNNQGSQGDNTTKPTEPDKPTTPEKKLVYVKNAEEVRTCQSGYTLENGECIKKTAIETKKTCSTPDYTELNGKCYIAYTETKIPICNGDDEYVRWKYTLDYGHLYDICLPKNGTLADRYPAKFRYECNYGGTLIGNSCLKEVGYKETKTCPNGYEISGSECTMKSQPTITYTCGNLIKQEDNKCYRYE